MNCEKIQLETLLPGMVDGSAEAAARHLTVCPDCRERLRVMVCLAALKPGRGGIRGRQAAARWLVAAALLLGLILSAPPRPDDTLPPSSPPTTRSAYPWFPLETRSRPPRPDIRELGFQAYAEGDFEEAARRLRGADDSESHFFLGVSLHLLGRPREALPWLDRAEKDPRWRRPARWYRANALLDLARTAEAKAVLLELSAGEGEFQRDSRELLKSPAFRSPAPKEDQ